MINSSRAWPSKSKQASLNYRTSVLGPVTKLQDENATETVICKFALFNLPNMDIDSLNLCTLSLSDSTTVIGAFMPTDFQYMLINNLLDMLLQF